MINIAVVIKQLRRLDKELKGLDLKKDSGEIEFICFLIGQIKAWGYKLYGLEAFRERLTKECL